MPSAEALRALANEILHIAYVLNGARLEGYLREALARRLTANYSPAISWARANAADLKKADFVYEARETLKDWVGEVRIEPTADGPDGFLALKRQGPAFYGRPLCGQNGSGGRI